MNIKNYFNKENIDLNKKVDNFIKSKYTDFGEDNKSEISDIIEKVAVWYELRYPDYEICKLMPGSSHDNIDINKVMFKKNKYINDIFDENSLVSELNWADFYNTHTFFEALPWKEKYLFLKPSYKSMVYFDKVNTNAMLYLTKNGIVEMSEEVSEYTNYVIQDIELIGMPIKEVIKLFNDRHFKLSPNNELEASIKEVKRLKRQKEELLNSIMYRIIERGGNRIGPRRGFIFAKEFDRNIDIPMQYGIDRSDPGLRDFINEYLKAGGNTSLECYDDYFYNKNKSNINKVKLHDILKIENNYRYTPEEQQLHQRLVNILNNQIDHDYVNKEEVKRLRLERKMNKNNQ